MKANKHNIILPNQRERKVILSDDYTAQQLAARNHLAMLEQSDHRIILVEKRIVKADNTIRAAVNAAKANLGIRS